MKRKFLSLIIAAACFTLAGCAEIKETPNSSAESSLSESSSEQSSASAGTYSNPTQEQSTPSSESSSVSSTSSVPDSSSIPVSSSTEASSSKPVSSSSSAASSVAVSSSKPVVSSSKPASSSKPISSSSSAASSVIVPISSSNPVSSSKPVSSSAPVSSSTTPQSSSSSVRNEQNPPKNPQIIGNYNQRAPEAWEIEYANEVFRLTNIERVKAGLPEFKQMALLDEAAQLRAWECLVSYDHTRPNGSKFSTALNEAGISWRDCGENIAAGQRTPQEVVNAWMNSTGHRANILNSDFVYLGVGFYYDYNNESGTPQYDYFWSQNFCR